MNRLLRFSARNLALAYVVVSLVMLAIFSIPLWYSWHSTIEQARDEVLQADTQKLVDLFNRQGADALASTINIQVGEQLENVETTIILFTDSAFTRIAGNLNKWPEGLAKSENKSTVSIDVGERVVQATLLHKVLPDGSQLLIGRDTGRFEKLENLFLYGLIGAGGIVLLLGVATGLLVRRTLLAKVHDINKAATAIMQGDLAHRLPAQDGESELNELVATENRMLEQIEHLVDGIRNVSNSIAHDLRTPLAELRFRLEELTLTRPSPEKVFMGIDSAINDVDHVIGIFNALLRLAEIDSGTRRAGFTQVDVAKVAEEVTEFYQPVAELQNVNLSFNTPGITILNGDRLLLAQAIGNLIDNALKYVQPNGTILVQVSELDKNSLEIAVMDDGPGISNEEKLKVMDRFYRSDVSRATPGVGLGLSLVAAVAKLHGGELKLSDNTPGLKAALALPL